MCFNKHSLQLHNQRMCDTLNMIFSANGHQSIADELENQRAPEGIFWSYVNRLRENLSPACVSLSQLHRGAERLRWNKEEMEEKSER